MPQSRQFQDLSPSTCLHVPPFAFDVLSLSSSFTLKYVTALSSAACFMATMASSETPWLITRVSLRRLGIICRSYSVPTPTGPPRVMTTTWFSCLPTSNTSSPLRMGYRAFATRAAPPRTAALTEVRFRLGCSFGLSFLQIPHWLRTDRSPLIGQPAQSFFGHPWLRLFVPSLTGRSRIHTD